MPLIKDAALLPEWCELKDYEIIRLKKGERARITRRIAYTKEKWIVGEGACEWEIDGEIIKAQQGDQFDILSEQFDAFLIHHVIEDAVLIRLGGNWGSDVGGSGRFTMEASTDIGNDGDPTDYARNTHFDNHYHDCDEFYIIYDGLGVVVTEGRHYIVSAGDCIATGMGHHHDIPLVVEPLKAVYFETTLMGQKRKGHLWNHTHGLAQPDPERI